MNKQYIAIDLKSFYASVECVERGLDPLTANLVVADESRTAKTICLAVSPSLKALGLPGRCRLFEVEQKAKEYEFKYHRKLEYIVAVPRMSLYMDYSTKIFNIYKKYVSADDIHVYSIDEVFIDATPYLNIYNMDAHQLAMTMIKDVLRNTGITATAGIGTNLYLSKVAMDIVAKHVQADEDGVRIAQLDEISYRKQLWDHKPLTSFWRVGPGIARRLQNYGLFTMGDVAEYSLENEDWFYKEFGIDAEILLDHAWGQESCNISDIKGYVPSANSLSIGQVLSGPYEKKKAEIIVREMADSLSLDLVDKGLVTEGIGLALGYDRISVDAGNYHGPVEIDHYGREVPKGDHGTVSFNTASSSSKKITDEAVKLFNRIMKSNLYVRRVNIVATRVIRKEDVVEQLDLFEVAKADPREEKVQNVILDIKKKYGKNAVIRGTNLQEGSTLKERNEQVGGHKANG